MARRDDPCTPLPCFVSEEAGLVYLRDRDGFCVAGEGVDAAPGDFPRLARCVNLLGPHLGRAELIEAVEGLIELAADARPGRADYFEILGRIGAARRAAEAPNPEEPRP